MYHVVRRDSSAIKFDRPLKAWLPSTPVTYQLHPTPDAVRGKTTPPATTFLAAELNIGKCHSSLGPSLSGMLYRMRSRRPSRWTVSSPGSPLSSNFTNPSPYPHSLPHPKSPLSNPTTPISSPLILNKNGKWDFWAWCATHYCINTTEPSKKWCWLYKRKKKKTEFKSHLF